MIGKNLKWIFGCLLFLLLIHAPNCRAETIRVINGVISLHGQGNYELIVEPGNVREVNKIEGLKKDDAVTLALAPGQKNIVIRNGYYLKLQQGRDFTLNHIYDRISLVNVDDDICIELTRSSGGD